MPDDRVLYRRIHQYKYQLMEPYEYRTDIVGKSGTVGDDWVVIDGDGMLKTKKGYAWDGPSGPTIDTRNFMRGSLVHDALYQLMRECILGQEHRRSADRLLQEICLADGMSRLRARLVYRAIRISGGRYAKPRKPAPIECAP